MRVMVRGKYKAPHNIVVFLTKYMGKYPDEVTAIILTMEHTVLVEYGKDFFYINYEMFDDVAEYLIDVMFNYKVKEMLRGREEDGYFSR